MDVRNLRNGRKGQAALFVTMTLTVSLGLVGLVVDIGWAYWRKEACGTAAISAAYAAVRAASSASNQSCGFDSSHWNCGNLSCPANPALPAATNLSNGCLYAEQNGYVNSGRQSVSLQGGTSGTPVSGISPSYWVSATVTESLPTFFSAVLRQNWTQVAMTSTAVLYVSTGGGCVYVLNQTRQGAWTQSGGGFTTGCGIYIDSNNSKALLMSGGTIQVNSGNLNIVGGKSSTGGTISFPGSGSLLTGQSAHGDPMSGLTAPTPLPVCLPDPHLSGGVGQSNITIPSGTYCGLTISGGSGLTLSGTYIMKSGSLTVSGGTVTTAAGGAAFYFPPSNSSGTVTYSGGGFTLNAPASGNMQGIAIWKDTTTANSMAMSGGNLNINGILYLPATALTYSGGTTPVQQTIIVDTITMSGGNISQPATSPMLNNGSGMSGTFIVQ